MFHVLDITIRPQPPWARRGATSGPRRPPRPRPRSRSPVRLLKGQATSIVTATCATWISINAGFVRSMHEAIFIAKPGLNVKMRSSRLQFALKYKDWTLDQWKRVAFSDETSVVLGHRRGGDYVWRTEAERNDRSVTSDRGTQSVSSFWRHVCRRLGTGS